MKHSGKVITSRLEGQRERIAWHEPSVAVGEEIPPATVVKVRDFPAKLHPGSEGMESRVEGTNPSSLSSCPHISCSAACWQGTPCDTIYRDQPRGKKNGELIWEQTENGLPMSL